MICQVVLQSRMRDGKGPKDTHCDWASTIVASFVTTEDMVMNPIPLHAEDGCGGNGGNLLQFIRRLVENQPSR